MSALTSFLLPKRHHFGISIGRTSLRGVEIDKGKVRSAVEVPLNPNIFQNGVLQDKKSFATQLNNLIIQGKFSTKYVVVCFSEAYAYSREYTLPIIPLSEVREAISWHLKDIFPFPEEDIYFDWKLQETNETEYKITVVAIQRQVLDSQVEVMTQVGLKPLGFKPGASVITKLLTLKPDQYALVTEVNKIGAHVTLVQSEKTLLSTVVNSTNQDDSNAYLKNVTATISEVIDYYLKKGILKTPTIPIILTGELATQEWIAASRAYVQNPVQILTTEIPNPAFNKAYSVALETSNGSSEDSETINLLPSAMQHLYAQERTKILYTGLFTRCIALVIIICLIPIASFITISLKRQNLDIRVKSLQNSVQIHKGNTKDLLLLNAQAKNIVELAPRRITPKEKLQVIASILPDTITITHWAYDDSKLLYTLDGEAEDRSELLAFKTKLEKTGEFAKVTLPLESLVSPKNVNFSITFVTK